MTPDVDFFAELEHTIRMSFPKPKMLIVNFPANPTAQCVELPFFEKLVALKTILPLYANDADFRKMFLDEAAIASRIEHTNVAQILDLGEHEGILYLVMEWVEGESVSRLEKAVHQADSIIPQALALRIGAERRPFELAEALFRAIEEARLQVIDAELEHRAQPRQAARFPYRGVEHLLLEAAVILAHHFDLQVLPRSEVREYAALAHLHPLGQETDRQALEAVPRSKLQRCVEDRGTGLFAFSHSFSTVQSVQFRTQIERPYYCCRRPSAGQAIF